MSIVETTRIIATVTIPLDVNYVYNEYDPGDYNNPPIPASVEVLGISIPLLDVLAALEEEHNKFEIEANTCTTHEEAL